VNEDASRAPDLAKAPAERAAAAVWPAAGLAYGAGLAMHAFGCPPVLDAGGASALLSAASWGAAGQGWIPRRIPAWVAVTGTWLTAADAVGPLHWWPAPVLSIAWAGIAIAASRAAHGHEAVIAAREWREARGGWLGRSHDWGLGGSHLLSFKRTRLGELYEVSTMGTGHLASWYAGNRKLEEYIAQQENLAASRVRIAKHGLAGRIMISVRRIDPWEHPLLHPLVCEEPEIELPEVRSILDEALVGQDPETGTALAIPLCDQDGAKRVSATANSGGGKGVLEDNLFEHVTACGDALAVHLNLSVKGYEDEESWGPACWLTAYGPAQKSRAAAVLKIIGEVIEWRTRNFKRGQYVPSPEHPAIIVFADESDAAVAAVRDGLNMIATKGRSAGVGYVHLGQRNTRDYADPKARSQDNVRCTGMVQNANEGRHAGSGTGPDMSTYGEGKPGVWKVELLGGGMSVGRTWVFHPAPAGHGAAVERVARERAFAQPAISGACAEYLGEPLATLLATEVYTRYAHAGDEGEEPDDPAADVTAPEAPAAPAEAQDPGPGTSPAAPAAGAKTAVADKDPLEEMWKMDLDEGSRAKLDALHEKLSGAREIIAETAARPKPPEVTAGALAAHTAERWRLIGEEARIPEECRARLLEMLGGEGTTISAIATEFGVTKPVARGWLQKYRNANAAYVGGTKRGSRWRLGTPPAGGPPENEPAPPEDGDAQLTPLLRSASRAGARGRPRVGATKV
jgi:transposase-like protein